MLIIVDGVDGVDVVDDADENGPGVDVEQLCAGGAGIWSCVDGGPQQVEDDEQSSQQVFLESQAHQAQENRPHKQAQSRKSTSRKKFYISFSNSFVILYTINSVLCRKNLSINCHIAGTSRDGWDNKSTDMSCMGRVHIPL